MFFGTSLYSFSTKGAAPLVFADQFLQLGTQLSSQYVYGLGEHREKFLISTNWTKAVFWARDVPPNVRNPLE